MQKYIQNIRLLALLILLSYKGVMGQALQWSNPTKLKGAAVFSKVLGENRSGIFMMRYRNRFYSKNIILERYNHLLVLEQSNTIDLRNARLVKIVMTESAILVVKSKFNKMNQINDLIAQWYTFDFKTRGTPVSLATIPVKEFGDRGNFRLRVNDSLKSISLLFTESTDENKIIINHKLFGIDLNAISQKRVELPYDYPLFYIKDFLLTNSNETHFLCTLVQKERRKIKFTSQILFVLKDSTLSDFLITDSLTIKSISLDYNRKEDNSVITAFYGLGDSYGLVGTLFFRLDSTRNNGETIASSFPEGFIQEVKVNDRNDGAISEGYGILKAIPRSDGGMMLIGEQKEVATEDDIILVNGIPQSTSKNIYNFNELIIINYDKDAFIDWHKVITKNQTTVNDGGYFSSVAIFVGDKFVQLLYNDQIRSSGDVMQYTVYNNGAVESNKLLKSQLDFVAIIPEESKQVSSNKLLIPTSKNRRFALLKLVYN